MLTMGQIEIRMQRAWKWFMRNEVNRWDTFKQIRDRYRHRRLPIHARIELCLNSMINQNPPKLSTDTQNIINQNWNVCK